MFRVRVLATTDGKNVGRSFLVPNLDMATVKAASGGRFNPLFSEQRPDGSVRIWNSHYTVILSVTPES